MNCSPYLRLAPRSLSQAEADIAQARRLREQSMFICPRCSEVAPYQIGESECRCCRQERS
jgi:hypothetical protein